MSSQDFVIVRASENTGNQIHETGLVPYTPSVKSPSLVSQASNSFSIVKPKEKILTFVSAGENVVTSTYNPTATLLNSLQNNFSDNGPRMSRAADIEIDRTRRFERIRKFNEIYVVPGINKARKFKNDYINPRIDASWRSIGEGVAMGGVAMNRVNKDLLSDGLLDGFSHALMVNAGFTGVADFVVGNSKDRLSEEFEKVKSKLRNIPGMSWVL